MTDDNFGREQDVLPRTYIFYPLPVPALLNHFPKMNELKRLLK